MVARKSSRKSKSVPTKRARPKFATTVAPETLAAIGTLADVANHKRNVGTVVDRLVWTAVARLLDQAADSYALRSLDFVRWQDVLPYAFSEAGGEIDLVIFGLLRKHGLRFSALSIEDRHRRRAELSTSHGVRVENGHWSTLDDFVELFVSRLS